jgi:predicted ATPase/class 3 adenylate cyclase
LSGRSDLSLALPSSSVQALPTGTVTLLFTDIEGSTRLWESHPDEMATVLARHDLILRTAIESEGCVFKTVGDAFCAAFAAARDAVRAAAAAQRTLHTEDWPNEVTPRVRIALHTGECEERDGDYFGPAVNRVARLVATAHGGQVVVSRSTAEVLGDQVPAGTQLVNLGPHDLKDLNRPEEVFQLVIDGVPASFPPLKTRGADEASDSVESPTNLTRPVSSFVGRDREMTQVTSLLRASRLVTLAGSGGVGKTRLATEVGRSLLDDTRDGVWLVELATIGDSALVATEMLSDLGLTASPGHGALESLIEVMASQSRLIILDNCEQVLEGCATLANAVLRGCPDVQILTTSREPLRIDGEVIYRVPSLSLPPEDAEDRSDLADSGAVALFAERASAQIPGFVVSDEDARLVGSICRRLDGMPLALELATARLRSMSLAKLDERLEHRFGLLTGGSRVALPRHQTLSALVDWSYDLLSEPERAIFRRASIFVDGFDLEAAEDVCALDDIDVTVVADHLASLVDKSLVVAEPSGDDLRYRYQQTLQQYAIEQLATGESHEGASETEWVRTAHADYFLRFADDAGSHLVGPSVLEWTARLDRDDLNLRAAIEHSLDTQDGATRVLGQFWSLRRYWRIVRRPAEAAALVERAVEVAGPAVGVADRAKALLCLAELVYPVDRRRHVETAQWSLELARVSGDEALLADALSEYGRGCYGNGRIAEAVVAGSEAVDRGRELGDPLLLGTILLRYGTTLMSAGGSQGDAEPVFLEAIELVDRTGDGDTAGGVSNNYALLLLDRGDLAGARHYLERSIALRGGALSVRTSLGYGNLAWVILQEGDADRARTLLIDALRLNRLDSRADDATYTVLGLACCSTALGAPELAAVLHGGADALLAVSADGWEILELRIRERDLRTLRDRLGEEFEPLYASGRAMAHDEIVRLALSS